MKLLKGKLGPMWPELARNRPVHAPTPPGTAPVKYNFDLELYKLLEERVANKARKPGNTALRTQKTRTNALFKIFKDLRGPLGRPISRPQKLSGRHIPLLVNYWYEDGQSAATIDNKLSLLRVLSDWIGKPGMVKPMGEYLPGFHRTYAAKVDRSPVQNGLDFWELFDRIYEYDKYVGMQLLAIGALGLRMQEAIHLKPLVRDQETYLAIEKGDGAKKDRPRVIKIDTPEKRVVLDTLKAFVLRTAKSSKAYLGNPNKTLKQNIHRFENTFKKFKITKAELGFTAHSFRQEFAINELARRNLIATVRGGSGIVDETLSTQIRREINDAKRADASEPGTTNQTLDLNMSTKMKTQIALLQVSNEMGHNRTSVMTAYSGPLRARKAEEGTAIQQEKDIENGIDGTSVSSGE